MQAKTKDFLSLRRQTPGLNENIKMEIKEKQVEPMNLKE